MSVDINYNVDGKIINIRYKDVKEYTEDIFKRAVKHVMSEDKLEMLKSYNKYRLTKDLSKPKLLLLAVLTLFDVDKKHPIFKEYRIKRYDFYYLIRERFGEYRKKAFEIYDKIKEEILLEHINGTIKDVEIFTDYEYSKLKELSRREYFIAYNNETKETSKYKVVKIE